MVALTSFGRRCRRSAPKDLLHSHVSSFPDLLSPTTPTGTNCASAIAHSGCCNNSSQQTSPFPAGSSRLSQPNRVHLSLRSIWFFSLLPTPPHGDAVTSSSRQHIGCQRPRSLTLKEDAALQRTRDTRYRVPPSQIPACGFPAQGSSGGRAHARSQLTDWWRSFIGFITLTLQAQSGKTLRLLVAGHELLVLYAHGRGNLPLFHPQFCKLLPAEAFPLAPTVQPFED
jgi:hypothetical protein